MKKLTWLSICILINLMGCRNSSSSQVYSSKIAILFMPEESMHDKVSGVTEEELASIEDEKTMAVYLLDSLGIPIKVTTDTLLTFKLADGTISRTNTRQFNEWGIVLFDPQKKPKLIYLNELEKEYQEYYGLP